MQYKPLGNSNLNVSIFSFGAWQIGDPEYWKSDTPADDEKTVFTAIDEGINLFDTAEFYGKGESEKNLGRILGSKRKDVLIASKVWPTNCEPKALRQSCEGSLDRLGTDYIDLYQVHWPPHPVAFADVFHEMERLKEEGKIREIGVSNFGPMDLDDWFASGNCISNQLGYNLFYRTIEMKMIPACEKYNLSILVYMPLFQGILSGRWRTIEEIPPNRRRTRHFSGAREETRHGESGCEEILIEALNRLISLAEDLGEPLANVSLAWLLAQPGVTSIIIGTRNRDQLRRNIASTELSLSEDTIREMNKITDPIKEHLGENADQWEPSEKSRTR